MAIYLDYDAEELDLFAPPLLNDAGFNDAGIAWIPINYRLAPALGMDAIAAAMLALARNQV